MRKKIYYRPASMDMAYPGEVFKRSISVPDCLISDLGRAFSLRSLSFVGKPSGSGNMYVTIAGISMTISKMVAECFGYNPPTLPDEVWKESVAAGIWVSNMGRLYSTWNLSLMNTYRKGGKKYRYVNDRERRRWPVHRLVALAFVEGRDIFRDCVDHINEDKADNRADNLRWCTNAENVRFYMDNHPEMMTSAWGRL